MQRKQRFYRLIAVLAGIVAWSVSVEAAEDEVRLASGLRERRLFKQAAFVCRQAINELNESASLATRDRERFQVALVVELIRIHSDQARFAKLDERAGHWQAARDEARRFLIAYPQHTRRLIVQLQATLIDSARVQLFQQEQEFGALSDLNRSQALELCRNFRDNLRAIDREIEGQLQDARNQTRVDSEMTASELTNLQRNVQFQIALAGFQRAHLYGAEDDDEELNRASALTEVLTQLSSLQRVNRPGTDLWWQTQLALARCYRRLGDFQEAQSTLDRAGESDLKNQRKKWHGPILVEQAELLLDSGANDNVDIDRVNQVLFAIDRQNIGSAQMDWLALKLVAAMKRSSSTKVRDQELLQQAKRRANLISRQHGPWWGTRANQLLMRTFEKSGQGSEIERRFKELVQTGQSAVAAKRFADAITAYEQAAEIAKQGGDIAAWRSCQINTSQSLEQLDRHALAAEKLIETATEDRNHSSSASIHLRGIWNLAQASAKAENQNFAYAKALQEHLNYWPGSKSADQVRMWLGKQQILNEQFPAAALTLLAVSAESKFRIDAAHAAALALEETADNDSAATLDRLAREFPRDPKVLLSQARVQTRIGMDQRPVRWDNPLKLWRSLAQKLKPETDQWFEAKYNVARLLVAAGEVEKAAQLLNYLAALPSGWESSPFANQLTDLQEQIQSATLGN